MSLPFARRQSAVVRSGYAGREVRQQLRMNLEFLAENYLRGANLPGSRDNRHSCGTIPVLMLEGQTEQLRVRSSSEFGSLCSSESRGGSELAGRSR